jgi:hypothetical protein
MLERLKKEIKGKGQQAKSKNLEVTKQQCINALEQCINQTIKVKPYLS